MPNVWLDLPSPEQARILQAIANHVTQHGVGPTLHQLTAETGLHAHSAASYHVRNLADAGWVTYERLGARRLMVSRTMRLTENGVRVLERYRHILASPIVRGTHELVLDRRAVAELRAVAAEHSATLPLHPQRMRMEGNLLIVRFRRRAQRDAWAAMLLPRLR